MESMENIKQKVKAAVNFISDFEEKLAELAKAKQADGKPAIPVFFGKWPAFFYSDDIMGPFAPFSCHSLK